MNKITLEYARGAIKKRRSDAHKGDWGKVLVIAGSKGMAGAAVICGRAAFRAGAGLVRIAIDEELYPIIQIGLPEATCVDRSFTEEKLNEYDGIALGPGLGDFPENIRLIEKILAGYGNVLVIDADGLNALAKNGKTGILKDAAAKVIITPHIGEAKRLLAGKYAVGEWSREYASSDDGRLEIAEKLVNETNAVVVLKGQGTIVASKEAGAFINTTGNSGMATGGSGDALAGVISAFARQTESCLDAAKAGVFVHGMAGDLARDALGEHGVMAMDIADKTALALKKVAAI